MHIYSLGTSYSKSSQNEEALKYWQMAVDLKNIPIEEKLHFGRGTTMSRISGDSGSASPNASLELARCYFWQEDHVKMTELFEQSNSEMGESAF